MDDKLIHILAKLEENLILSKVHWNLDQESTYGPWARSGPSTDITNYNKSETLWTSDNNIT